MNKLRVVNKEEVKSASDYQQELVTQNLITNQETQEREDQLSSLVERPVKVLSRSLEDRTSMMCAYVHHLEFPEEYRPKELVISWDEKKRQFEVSVTYDTRNKSKISELIAAMPLQVAEHSSCSCGSPLLLKDHTIQKQDSDVTFEGTYVCSICNAKNKTIVQNIMSSLGRFWHDTTKVEIGPTGIKYEKKSENVNNSNKE